MWMTCTYCTDSTVQTVSQIFTIDYEYLFYTFMCTHLRHTGRPTVPLSWWCSCLVDTGHTSSRSPAPCTSPQDRGHSAPPYSATLYLPHNYLKYIRSKVGNSGKSY